MCAMSVAVGHLKLTHNERAELVHTYIPWAIRNSKQCGEALLSFNYEANLHMPIEILRKQLNFEIAPHIERF